MQSGPERQEHPKSAYLIGLFVVIVMLFVFGGVVNHLAFSSHGPGLLLPIVNKLQQKQESAILREVQLHEESEIHRHFHHFVDYPEIQESQKETCFICHSKLPHGKNKKIRALLNMHTEFFVCETCHLKNDDQNKVVYKWYSPLEKEPKGPFIGMDYNPVTGMLQTIDDHVSKIAPFIKNGNTLDATIQLQDNPMAKDFINVRDRLTPEQREGFTKKFHASIKPVGHACTKCHSTQSIINFKELGFSEKRKNDLEQLSITGIITKYNEFFLPDFFTDNLFGN